MTTGRPRVRFARPHYAPGLEWPAYQLLPDWEIFAGDPSASGAIDGVDVLVVTAVDAELIDPGGFGLIQQIGTGTDRIDVAAATEAGVWVSSVPALPDVSGVTEDMFRRVGPVLAGELERWRSGRPPLHAVTARLVLEEHR